MPTLNPNPINTLASIPALPTGNMGDSPGVIGAVTISKPSGMPLGSQIIAEAVQIASLTVTSAQLLALKGADVLLVPAPNAGYAIDAQSVSLRLNFKTTAYTVGTGTLRVYLGPSANGVTLIPDQSSLIGVAVTTDNIGIPTTASGNTIQANVEKQGVYLGNQGAVQFTLGDGTLDVVVAYIVIQM